MAAYILVDVSIRDAETYERYKVMAPPSIAQYGGRYIVRGGRTHCLEGSWGAARFVMLEFPTLDAARAWWSSPEYAPAKALRQASADTDMLLVEGLP